MQFRCYRVFLFLLLCIAIVSTVVMAGTTGKIAGQVVDNDTGEPLPGVNVLVKGTYMGAATDIDGYFTILNVPPGMHTLEASMIGYATVTVEEVRVFIDQTATVNIDLIPQSLEMDAVVVVAKRDLVKKDVFTSVVALEPEEIDALPVSSVESLVGLQAGVEDGLVVRGGSADQLLFQMDGVTLRDPRNNQPITSVPMSSIQEISIERGGFNAEYGEVRSGMVNIVSKEGSLHNYNASIQVKYSPATKKHFGISVYDPESMWNKPYLDSEVAWTGTQSGAWDEYTRRQYPDFEGWNSLSEALLNDDDPSNDLSPAAAQKVWQWERRRRPSIEPDYIIDGGLGGPFPFISESLGNLRFYSSLRYEKEMLLIPLSRDDYKDYSGTVKINSDISRDLKIQLTGTMGRNYDVVMNSTDRQFDDPSFGINGVQYWSPTNFIRTPYEIAEVTNEQRPSRIFTNSWYSQAKVDHLALAGKLTHYLNPTTFYDVSLEYINRDYTTGPIDERDYTKKYEVVPGYFVDEAPYGFSSQPNTGITGMFFGGHSSQIRDSSDISSYALNADITSQVTKEHLLKAGIQLYYYDLNLNYGTVREFFGDYNYVNDTWNPLRFSAYIQDKIEMLGFIANLGLRMDISDPNTSWADVGPFNKEYFSGSYSQDANIEMKEVNADVYLSPRLGISHPVTENSKIYFNYGHFKQMPPYEEIFRIGRSTNGSMQNYGDPTLDQAKTIAYQLGYDHSLFDAYLIQIAAFYNDISDQQDYTQYVDDRAGIGYYRANNDSYEDIRGLEITLRKNNGVWFRGFTNFTYQVSTQGGFGRPTITANPRDQQVLDQTTSLKYQQKPVPQPRGNVNLTFLTPFDYGPDILGLKPFSDWSINLLAEYRAGEHLTYNPDNVTGIQNNVQVTDYSNFDLRINKAFDFNSITIMLYMEFRNLFNQKRLSGAGFYDVYDQQFYFQSLHLPESDAYDNIPGDDRIGDYRKKGVEFQPIEQVSDLGGVEDNSRAIFYTNSKDPLLVDVDGQMVDYNHRYLQRIDGDLVEVDSKRMDKILEDKAYIDMPNNTSFNFLNPRQIFFGINISFNL